MKNSRFLLPILGVIGAALLSGCSGTGATTCDEYAAMSYTERTDVERQLLNAHNLDPISVSNGVGVAENIQVFCGLGALDAYVGGSNPASRNNSSSIEDAVDWASDSW